MDWQAMESAPRDGSRVIGWFGDRAIVVFWRSGPEYTKRRAGVTRQTGNTIWYWSDGYSRYPEPEAWIPEPSPPELTAVPAGRSENTGGNKE